MFKILFFTIKRQLLANFKTTESKLGLFSQVFFVVSLVLTGFGVGFGLDLVPAELLNGFKIGLVLVYGSSLAMLAFFPDYRDRPRIVSKIHPIPSIKRWLINISYDFFDAMTLGTFATFIIVDICSKTYTTLDLALSILFLMNVKVAVYILKTIIEEVHAISYLKWIWVLLLASFTAVLIIVGLDSWMAFVALFLTFAMQILLSISFERHYIGLSSSKNSSSFLNNTGLPAIYLTFLKSSKSRKGYLTGLVIKVLLLVVITSFDTSKVVSSSFILVLYLAPTTIFSYFGNNLWGFYSEIWASTIITKPADTVKRFFQLMALPLVIDFVLVFLILLIGGKLVLSTIVFYFTATAMLLLNGYIFSHQKPIVVAEGISYSQMKPKVNGWSSFLSLFLVGFAYLLRDYIWVSSILIVITGLIFYSIYKEFRADKKLNYEIFDAIKG